ncbi:CYFA0S02e09120g1_1 [Cyberlindnera fabianii]|uniref:Genetic interactor of prohibitins 3, mitochondrial n=1 Tax=Cyberlindnera fabianii TaxID=36022 RepID=A0A061AW66_CYBFA|nr:CYFA0S02e09120g1_1 [Cyberlindnera fabianii]
MVSWFQFPAVYHFEMLTRSSRTLRSSSLLSRAVRLVVKGSGASSNHPHNLRYSSSSHQSQENEISQIFKPKLERSEASNKALLSCTSCGIHLQKSNPDQVGYYIEPKKEKTAPLYRTKSLQFLSAFSKLDEEGRKLLNSQSYDALNPSDIQQQRQQQSPIEEELICQRCHNALHHNIYIPSEHQPLNLHEVLDSVPPRDGILHVFSAYDFPLSLVSLRGRRNVTYAINKIDMLFGHDTGVRKYSGYFNTMVNRLVGQRSQLHIISAHTSWSVDRLYDSLGKMTHLVGFVNAGKTRLANRIMNVASSMVNPGRRLKKVVGSSHLPALTRENITHNCSGKVIVDTPGFLDSNNLFGLIKEEHLKSVLQGRKVLMQDLKRERYESLKGGQCLTVGGLFFLKAPKDTIVQVKPVCRGKPWTFSSIEKAVDTVKNPPTAMKDMFYVKPEKLDQLVRFAIPPFYGSVDLVIKDVGYVQITPTGKKNTEELFEVYAPRGVVLGVRETIEHFMTKYLKQQSIKKTKVKGQLVDKDTLKMKAMKVPDYKVFSRLYEIPMDCTDPFDEMKSQYARHVREFGTSYHRVDPKDTRDETRNEYWIEKV